eukprot:3655196-Rhodomonas_salina.1
MAGVVPGGGADAAGGGELYYASWDAALEGVYRRVCAADSDRDIRHTAIEEYSVGADHGEMEGC